MLSLVKDICSFGERQAETSIQVSEYLVSVLKHTGLPYIVKNYPASIPLCKNSYLMVDGVEMPAISCSFIGGRIDKNCQFISSLQSSKLHFNVPNLNYNQQALGISTPNYYCAPAMAVDFKHLEKLKAAKQIEANSVVVRYDFTARQVLIGNTSSPKNILFSHYDSLFCGAVDNASGVAVLLYLLKKYPHLASTNLFIFDGNEELSYDFPVYWGHGYRVFQEAYDSILHSAEKVFAVDCLGYDTPSFYSDPSIVRLALPLDNLEKYTTKSYVVSGSVDKLMVFYHSANDTVSLIKEELLYQAAEALLTRIL